MGDKILKIVATVNSYLTDYILIILLVAVGLYYTIRTRFVQIRCFGEGLKKVFGKQDKVDGKKGLSSFQAVTTAIAAQVGTGNIVGACGAIIIGGPGAIFWMWIIAFLGMATIYSEAVLAQETRIISEDGTISGGPVYYIKKAFKGKFGKVFATCFSVFVVLALGFFGAMVQSNSISESFYNATSQILGESFTLDPIVFGLIIGIIVAIISGFIFIGGVKRLGSVTEKIVPIMAGLYLLGGLIVIFARIKFIPETFGLIFKYAFIPNALIGGAVGTAIKTAISQGAKRGLFSNEAGMGSTPHAHALADVKTPHEQGVAAIVSVFIDTFVVLTITALVVISTLYAGGGVLSTIDLSVITAENGFASIAEKTFGIVKTNMAQIAFGTVFGETLGSVFVAVCLFFFAFSTVLSWNMFGRINMVYLFGKKSNLIYSIIAIIFIILGSMLSNNLVWELTDFFNYLMVIPNVLALFFLSKTVINHSKKKSNKEVQLLDEENK